jgi:hypothetical protein
MMRLPCVLERDRYLADPPPSRAGQSRKGPSTSSWTTLFGLAMRSSLMAIDGTLLHRGFWLYVCEVRTDAFRRVYYVGRTGDSSSANASSPFRRLARHLDDSRSARSNSLYRALVRYKLNPIDCRFRIYAFGPLYRETRSPSSHWVVRNKVAALEFALAKSLINSGYHVMGQHASRARLSENQKHQLTNIIRQLNREARLHVRSCRGL